MRKFYKNIFLVTASFLLLFAGKIGEAHEIDNTYLYLRIYKDKIEGRIEISGKDLNRQFDINVNPEFVEEEVSPHFPMILNYLEENISFENEGKTYIDKFTHAEIYKLDDEQDHIKFYFELTDVEEIPDYLDIKYNCFFNKENGQEKNTHHQGVLIVEYNWKAGIINNYSLIADVFKYTDRKVRLSLTEATIYNGFRVMVQMGAWHIWIGWDHILFLVALILPAVVRRKEEENDIVLLHNSDATPIGSWLPVAKFKPAFFYILKIVTFFTIAHSVTLAIAYLDIISLPSKYVESLIAISIALAAFHNIKPIFSGKEWLIALVFGLFHGFGFAGVLGEKGIAGDYLVLTLFGFNLGVELGQVAIIAVTFPLLFLFRKSSFYPRFLTFGSIILILISINWTIERLFEFNIPIGRWINSFFG